MQIKHVLAGKAFLDSRIPNHDNCLYWRDDLSRGPVPASKSLSHLSRVREAFWNSKTSLRRFDEIERNKYLEQTPEYKRSRFVKKFPSTHSLVGRDRDFESLDLGQTVVWCGQNVRDILMLAATLHYSDEIDTGIKFPAVARCPGSGPGAYNADKLARAFEGRVVCTAEAVRYLAQFWSAYTAEEPTLLNQLVPPLDEGLAQWCSQVLPDILEEYPSLDGGLSRTEAMLLQEAAAGRSVVWIVAETLDKLEGKAVGDGLLFETLWHFLMEGEPLLEPVGAREVHLASAKEFRNLVVRPSPFGRQVLSGQKDYVKSGMIDRWVGGVHLKGNSTPWRLDRQWMRIVEV